MAKELKSIPYFSRLLARTLPYYGKLVRIRREFERNRPGFPLRGCMNVTRAIAEDLGLEQLAGGYLPEKKGHSWNFDSKTGLYVDLSMDQFGVKEKIVVIPPLGVILKQTDKATKVQREAQFDDRYGRPRLAEESYALLD